MRQNHQYAHRKTVWEWWIGSETGQWERSLWLTAKLTKSVHEKRNRISVCLQLFLSCSTTERQGLTSLFMVCNVLSVIFSIRNSYNIKQFVVSDSSVKMISKCCCVYGLPGSYLPGFPFLIMNTDYCHPLIWRVISSHTGAKCASWPLAVVFIVCSSATFWPQHRRRGATQQSAFAAAGSLMSVCGVWALRLSGKMVWSMVSKAADKSNNTKMYLHSWAYH